MPVVVVATFAVFVLVAGATNPLAELRARGNVPDQTIELRVREAHLDEPAPVRFLRWAGGVAAGELGTSMSGEPVAAELARAGAVTLRMILLVLVIALALTLVWGAVSALRPSSLFDNVGTVVAFVFLAMPVFWLAGILKDVALRFNGFVGSTVFYVVGEQTPELVGGFLDRAANQLGHLALPVLTLALLLSAEWSRFLRSSMIDALGSDYVRTARSEGLRERRVIGRYALRNALVPLTTVVALSLARLLGGAVLTEFVFEWHGMGELLLDGLRDGDVNLVAGWMLVTATAIVVFNLLADVAYGWLDPRVRR